MRLRPTFRSDPELLNLFYTAETLCKTVDELLTGEKRPISAAELDYWVAYRSVKQQLMDEESKKANKKGANTAPEQKPFKKTMGR